MYSKSSTAQLVQNVDLLRFSNFDADVLRSVLLTPTAFPVVLRILFKTSSAPRSHVNVAFSVCSNWWNQLTVHGYTLNHPPFDFLITMDGYEEQRKNSTHLKRTPHSLTRARLCCKGNSFTLLYVFYCWLFDVTCFKLGEWHAFMLLGL
jgi:hypothetical protein